MLWTMNGGHKHKKINPSNDANHGIELLVIISELINLDEIAIKIHDLDRLHQCVLHRGLMCR